jgi:hypothetical protein
MTDEYRRLYDNITRFSKAGKKRRHKI